MSLDREIVMCVSAKGSFSRRGSLIDCMSHPVRECYRDRRKSLMKVAEAEGLDTRTAKPSHPFQTESNRVKKD